MDDIYRGTHSVSRFYHRPAHAIRIFERELRAQAAFGRSLQSITHIYSLGTGIRLRFDFAESSPLDEYRLTYCLGRLRAASTIEEGGWRLDAVVPMKALWVPIGHFYLLRRQMDG